MQWLHYFISQRYSWIYVQVNREDKTHFFFLNQGSLVSNQNVQCLVISKTLNWFNLEASEVTHTHSSNLCLGFLKT